MSEASSDMRLTAILARSRFGMGMARRYLLLETIIPHTSCNLGSMKKSPESLSSCVYDWIVAMQVIIPAAPRSTLVGSFEMRDVREATTSSEVYDHANPQLSHPMLHITLAHGRYIHGILRNSSGQDCGESFAAPRTMALQTSNATLASCFFSFPRNGLATPALRMAGLGAESFLG